MRLLLRLLGLPAVLLSLLARAQTAPPVLTPQPLTSDPSRAYVPALSGGATQRTAALALPFFEDFTLPRDGQPSPLRWQPATTTYPNGGLNELHYAGGGAYVSNRLASEPLTRGTATLDGLRANGRPYTPGSASLYSATDTLTSQPIDLSSYSAAANLYLSYAWQAGSLVGAPVATSSGAPVFLTLEFLDNVGRWNTIWTYNAEGKTTRFRQQIFPISQASYFHANFRFRFRASGNQASSRDAFGVDYVYLNNNRAANDTIFQDIATSRGLSSPLQSYTAMPTWQYAASSASPLNPTMTTTVNNLLPSGNPTPISWQGTVRELTSGGFGPATWVSGNQPLLAGARQVAISGDARTAALPATGIPGRYRYALALQTNETNPLTLPNDTTYRDLELTDYYAFDDGTAESFLTLPAVSTGPFTYYAYPITAAKADQVKSIRLAPIFNNIPLAQGGENFQNRSVTVAVWADNNGQPANTPLATQAVVIPNPLPTTGQVFFEVSFANPVSVSGRFYIGYGQASGGQFLPYGFDLNNGSTAPVLFYNNQGTWSKPTLSTPGTIMMRAVMTNNLVLATQAQQSISTQFSLYPNPSPRGTAVVVSGPAFRRAAVLDVLGRPVWQQPAAEAGRPTLQLPASLAAGVYLVQLTLPDGSVATRRLAVE
ncbi:T9SS type A sorting domain-containing protein [Hymenobacter cheonanensis]|uniref:T9SS type A sorting domain-containing protein n=1 Tax=Hymenobacter sp. CA2-7 TaxID=3063993 RepID=UPI00271360F7|nr:T9SS type A sorting domain-containing protein [Hymenobacter sp. CA2-7]MDO7884323.1 T9SS type A sorting domain-containing protein [Hymenobacter sp. CA2-7]